MIRSAAPHDECHTPFPGSDRIVNLPIVSRWEFIVRYLLSAILLLGALACTPERATDSSSIVLRVLLLDDRYASAGRHEVTVTPVGGSTISVRTGGDGTTSIELPGAGTYEIHVIPRDGFAANPDLTRIVTLAPGASTVVAFVLYRVGVGIDPFEPRTG